MNVFLDLVGRYFKIDYLLLPTYFYLHIKLDQLHDILNHDLDRLRGVIGLLSSSSPCQRGGRVWPPRPNERLFQVKNFCLEPFGHARIEPAFHAACLNSSAKSLLQHISLFGADADPNFYLR